MSTFNPRKGLPTVQVITMRLDEETSILVRKHAKKAGITHSHFIRECIKFAIDNYKI